MQLEIFFIKKNEYLQSVLSNTISNTIDYI